ncbi:MAG TPA: hypothetical protein VLS89_15590, partial [Candidatus Nanopelagicales bacterium]|nr:hypothetical protein [Candidatus Nanopelagicales bacterium]
MNMKNPWILACLTVGAASIVSFSAGCELIATADRSLIGEGGAGGGAGGEGGSGGEPTTTTGGGMGGMGGA